MDAELPLPPNVRSVSLAWFRQADWPQWCAIDPDFQPDYHHWLRRAEAEFQRRQALQQPVQKVLLDPAAFLAWSRANGGQVNSQARQAFTAILAREIDRSR